MCQQLGMQCLKERCVDLRIKRAIGCNDVFRNSLLRYILSTHNNLAYEQLTMREVKNAIKSSNMVRVTRLDVTG